MIVLSEQPSEARIRIGWRWYDLPTWARYLTIDADGDVDVHEARPFRRAGFWDVPAAARRMPLGDAAPPDDWTAELYELPTDRHLAAYLRLPGPNCFLALGPRFSIRGRP